MDQTHLSLSAFDLQTCVLCGKCTSEKLTTLTDVGLETLRTSCEVRRQDDLLAYLESSSDVVRVHSSCRKSFTRSSEVKKIKLQLESPSSNRLLRSVDQCFQWKSMCFFVLEWPQVRTLVEFVR